VPASRPQHRSSGFRRAAPVYEHRLRAPLTPLYRLRNDSWVTVREPDEHLHGDDTALLIAALNHLSTVYDARINRMYQMVNYFLVSSAILATAYAAAINGKHYGIAVVLSLAEIGITAFVVLLVLRELRSAASVVPALVEVRDQIAIRLKTDSIRMVSTPPGREQRRSVVITASTGVLVLALIDITLLLYALIH
jgi:hypothetical protein